MVEPVEAPNAPRKPRMSPDGRRQANIHNQAQPITDDGHSNTIDISDGEMDDCTDEPMVFCVKIPYGEEHGNITKEEMAYLKETFELMKDKIQPVWKSAKDCMKIHHHDINYYIVPAFRGPVFRHLETMRVKRIYGPLAVRCCLATGEPLPMREFPVFSLNLQNSVVTFTGVGVEKRKQLKDMVRYMNGIVSDMLTMKTTHLVAEACESTSNKYTEARRMSMPVVGIDWIEKAWQSALHHDETVYTSSSRTRDNLLPVFTKMVITTSGVVGAERSDIHRLIELNGGKPTGEMARTSCTHLITDKTNGEKYRKAREWGTLKIVQTRWVRKCVESGYVLPEKAFDPDRLRSSTPVKDGAAPEELEFSAIAGGANRLNTSTLNTQQFKALEHELGNSTVDNSTSANKTPATAPRPGVISRRRETATAPISGLPDPIDDLDDALLRGDFDFLEGCLVWLCGVEDRRLERWHRALDRSGATRVSSFESASHILVVNVGNERANLQMALEKGIVVVMAEWVMECFKQMDHASTDEFLWKSETIICRTSSITTTPTASTSGNNMTTTPIVPASERSRSSTIEIARDSRSNTMMNSVRRAKTVGGSVDEHLNVNLAPLGDRSDSDMSVFNGKLFSVRSADECFVSRASKEIRNLGGVIMNEKSTALVDYLLCEQVDYGSIDMINKCKEIVTEFWLKRCREQCIIVPVSGHPLFRPIPACEGSDVFHGVVAVISGLGSYDKAVLGRLVEMFGGKVQDTLITKPKEELLACTHLIAGSVSQRVTQAKKDRVKIVDPSWVVESIINDKMMSESQYQLNKEAYASYAGRTDDLWRFSVSQQPAVQQVTPKSPRRTSARRSLKNIPSPSPAKGEDEMSNILLAMNVDHITPQADKRTTRKKSKNNETFDPRKPFKPRFQLDGAMAAIDAIPSPMSEAEHTADTTDDSLSVSRINCMLKVAVEKTSRPPASGANPLRRSGRSAAANLTMMGSSNGSQRSTIQNDPPIATEPTQARRTRSQSSAVVRMETDEQEARGEGGAPDDERQESEAMREARLLKEKTKAMMMEFNKNHGERIREEVAKKSQSTTPSTPSQSVTRKRFMDLPDSQPPAKKALFETAASKMVVDWVPKDSLEEHGHEASSSTAANKKANSPRRESPAQKSKAQQNNAFARPGPPITARSPVHEETMAEAPEATMAGITTRRRSSNNQAEPPKSGIQPPTVRKESLSRVPVATVQQPQRQQPPTPAMAKAKTPRRSAVNVEEQPPVITIDSTSTNSSSSTMRMRPAPGRTNSEVELKMVQKLAPETQSVRKFVFTSIAAGVEREHIEELIRQLGGEIVQSECVTECTHVISGKLIRGAKIMGAIASGKWILRKEYVLESAKHAKWLEESQFEWCTPEFYIKLKDERVKKLAEASRRWRITFSDSAALGAEIGAFVGWRVMMYCTAEKAESIAPLLIAGGATVMARVHTNGDLKPHRPTHAIIAGAPLPTKEDLQEMLSIGCVAYSLDYLSSFLLDEVCVAEDWLHADYSQMERESKQRK